MSGINVSPFIVDTVGWKSLCTGKKGGGFMGGEALPRSPGSSSQGGSAVPVSRCAAYRELHHEASLSSRDATWEHSRATSISKPVNERVRGDPSLEDVRE